MRFVDDGVTAGRDDFAVRALPHGEVGAEQVVVDDHDVGGCGLLPHPRDEAVVVSRTIRSEAGLCGRRHVVPERQILGKVLELSTVAMKEKEALRAAVEKAGNVMLDAPLSGVPCSKSATTVGLLGNERERSPRHR